MRTPFDWCQFMRSINKAKAGDGDDNTHLHKRIKNAKEEK